MDKKKFDCNFKNLSLAKTLRVLYFLFFIFWLIRIALILCFKLDLEPLFLKLIMEFFLDSLLYIGIVRTVSCSEREN